MPGGRELLESRRDLGMGSGDSLDTFALLKLYSPELQQRDDR